MEDNVLESRVGKTEAAPKEAVEQYEVLRSQWGNDYQYHYVRIVNGKEVSRAPAPEWAYEMFLQIRRAQAGISGILDRLLKLAADSEQTDAVRAIARELTQQLRSTM